MRVMGRNYCNLCQKEIGGFESHCQECKRTIKICDSKNKDNLIAKLQAQNAKYKKAMQKCIKAMEGSNCVELKWLIEAIDAD